VSGPGPSSNCFVDASHLQIKTTTRKSSQRRNRGGSGGYIKHADPVRSPQAEVRAAARVAPAGSAPRQTSATVRVERVSTLSFRSPLFQLRISVLQPPPRRSAFSSRQAPISFPCPPFLHELGKDTRQASDGNGVHAMPVGAAEWMTSGASTQGAIPAALRIGASGVQTRRRGKV
jgi:hypothetical protein